MAEYDLMLSPNLTIDFFATGDAAILQNVAMVFASVAKSCPMARNFAWDGSVLDRPQNLVQSVFAAAIMSALAKYEPRANLVQLAPTTVDDGTMTWKVRVKINE